MINIKKLRVQKEAVDKWSVSKFNTMILYTGMGKTWIFFNCLIKSRCKICYILAETTVRERDIQTDRLKFKEVFGKDPFEGVDVRFLCYHSADKINFKEHKRKKIFVFADEVHEMVTPTRFLFTKSQDWKNCYFLGLTATLDKEGQFTIGERTDTKYNFLNDFAPICFNYKIENAIDDKTTRDLEVITYLHTLDSIKKTIEVQLINQTKLDDYLKRTLEKVIEDNNQTVIDLLQDWETLNLKQKSDLYDLLELQIGTGKKSRFYITEKQQYDYLNAELKKYVFLPQSESKDFLLRNVSSKRMRLLHSLPSKIELCKQLLSKLKGRTLVFGYDSKTLISLGIPAIVSENENMEQDLLDFREGKINQVGSNKILLQGANLGYIDNIILIAYDSKPGKMTQKAGSCILPLST